MKKIAALQFSLLFIFSYLVIIVEIAPVAGATTIYVDDSGGADYTRIQDAIYIANPGDTIFVYNGTYNGLVFVNTPINLIGEDINNTIIDGNGSGTVVRISADFVNMSGFTVKNSGEGLNDAGIELSSADYCNVFNNNVSNSWHGIRFHSANNNLIKGNYFYNNNNSGIAAYSFSNYNVINENIFLSNGQGIHLSSNYGHKIMDNTFISNRQNDIHIKRSSGTLVTGNTMTGWGLNFEGATLEDWVTHEIDDSNLVNGKPVYYRKNQSGGAVPQGVGQVILANCTNVKIENQKITDAFIGIVLGLSSNNNITGGNKIGMYFYHSDANNIKDNIIFSNDKGIWFYLSEANFFLCNNISSNNHEGIFLDKSQKNIIVGNNISSNKGYGVYIKSDLYNKIFHNNFMKNVNQAYDGGKDNYWDYGYPSGGNYWSDFTGIDIYYGQDQNITGDDGIIDTPYTSIDGSSGCLDNFPLFEPWIMDNSLPEIFLLSPTNNSIIRPGVIIIIYVYDLDLYETKYVLEGGHVDGLTGQPTKSLFALSTTNWIDDNYEVKIYTVDIFGNSNTSKYYFTIDSSPPYIQLESPMNYSLLTGESTLDFDVSDENLIFVNYSINHGSFMTFEDPYELDTTDWEDGDYIITISAVDAAENSNEKWFVFIVNTNPPFVLSTSLEDEATDIGVNEEITIEFSEPMDADSVESAISIEPDIDFLCLWSSQNKTLTMNFSESFRYNTQYRISISIEALDTGYRGLENKFVLEFTTDEGFPVRNLLFSLLLIIAVAIIIIAFVISKKKKGTQEIIGSPIEIPPTFQVLCSVCKKVLQVNDIGVTQNVSCPFCTTVLTVTSRKAAFKEQIAQPLPQIQPMQQVMPISCPKCSHIFSVPKTKGSMRVQCPNCGITGTFQ
jgi:parallel beta-helix repeat protein